VIRTIVLSLGIPGLAAATVIPVAFATSEFAAAGVFTTITLLMTVMVVAARRWLPASSDHSIGSLLAQAAACWLTVAVSTSVITWTAVHAISAGGASELEDPLSAVFESVSGLSTTGLTMLGDPAEIDAWLQWWRSIIQWVGAIGVALFAATAAEPTGDHDTLVGAEWTESPGSTAQQTVRRLALILATITVASALAMIAVGEPVWRAVNHSITAASTAGFSIATNSAADSSWPVRLILALTLLVAAMSFGTLWDRARRTGVPLWRRTQIRFGLGATAACLAVALVVADGFPLGDVAFNAISASTTGGFSAGTSYRLVEALGAVAMVSMFIGGAAGSTAGGIKAARLAWLTKAAVRWIPGEKRDEDEPFLWDGMNMDAITARYRIMGAGSIVVTWLLVTMIGSIVMAVHNRETPFNDVLFEAISAGSGVGLSSGLTDADLDATTKLTLSVLMLAGRVEMTAFLMLLAAPFVTLVRRRRRG